MRDGGWSYSGDGVLALDGRRHVYSVYPTGEMAGDGRPFFRWVTFSKATERHVAHGLAVGEEAAMIAAIDSAARRREPKRKPSLPPAPPAKTIFSFSAEAAKERVRTPVLLSAAERGYLANLLSDAQRENAKKPPSPVRDRTAEGISALRKRMEASDKFERGNKQD